MIAVAVQKLHLLAIVQTITVRQVKFWALGSSELSCLQEVCGREWNVGL